jgi:hypothetical protein
MFKYKGKEKEKKNEVTEMGGEKKKRNYPSPTTT